ncbi:MAG TPA: bifunctional DNA-binding transcriptional regulator/O6-methylguanine-DNA methyltransferase Ada [Burkholderiaceae bacterium]|nr:bifunctional DNA-binding transcriptional regulator/O6-methylguanine-DNA methyltransferase Ada [Burkholderiaceae bacterium]
MRPIPDDSINRDTEHARRWAAVVARDPAADDAFVYAVKTTGVYARPSSASRLPRPENVEFFTSAADAEAAGYRPSRRASADQSAVATRHAAIVARACRHIETSDTAPSLQELAEGCGMSPFHFHRIFKTTTGLTPREYAGAHRAARIRQQLNNSPSVTDAIYDAGYNSNSRFYETSTKVLGMKPSDYRSGGVNADIRFAIGQSSLGAILVAQSARGICAILLGEDPEKLAHDLQDMFPRANLLGGDAAFEQLVATVVGFVEAPSLGLQLPLDIRGTVFQQRVWKALLDIPPGSTVSYTELARRIGAPAAVRAVASACAANRLAVAIPCHRVVRSNGGLSGYRWGVERKRTLLDREAGQPD